MRKPRARLASIHAESLQPALQSDCEPGRLSALVSENEHSDGARLAVAHGLELERWRLGGGLAQRGEDGIELAPRACSQERKRDVKALDRSATLEVACPPDAKRGRDVIRELECEKEPETLIPLDRYAATGVTSPGCVPVLQQLPHEMKRSHGRPAAHGLAVSGELDVT